MKGRGDTCVLLPPHWQLRTSLEEKYVWLMIMISWETLLMIDAVPITRQRFGLITHLLQLLLTAHIKSRKWPTRYLLNINIFLGVQIELLWKCSTKYLLRSCSTVFTLTRTSFGVIVFKFTLVWSYSDFWLFGKLVECFISV